MFERWDSSKGGHKPGGSIPSRDCGVPVAILATLERWDSSKGGHKPGGSFPSRTAVSPLRSLRCLNDGTLQKEDTNQEGASRHATAASPLRCLNDGTLQKEDSNQEGASRHATEESPLRSSRCLNDGTLQKEDTNQEGASRHATAVKHLFSELRQHLVGPAMVTSLSGGKVQDFFREVDRLPRAIKVLVLHIGTNNLANEDPQDVLRDYAHLLDYITQTTAVKYVACTTVLPRTVNRHLKASNLFFVRKFNERADLFNELLRDHCKLKADLFALAHQCPREGTRCLLATDGLHPNFDGVKAIARKLEDFVEKLLFMLSLDRS